MRGVNFSISFSVRILSGLTDLIASFTAIGSERCCLVCAILPEKDRVDFRRLLRPQKISVSGYWGEQVWGVLAILRATQNGAIPEET